MNLRTPTLVTLVLCAPYLCADEPTPEEIADAGARYQKNCMACHQPPDLRFETDRAWVSRIRETAWSGHAPESVREALIKFFEEGGIDAPDAVDAPPEKIDDRTRDGFVTTNIRQGSLFIKDGGGKVIRLAWDNAKVKDGAKPEWRSVPPGEYTLIGYRIRRQDDAGTEWFVSANSPKGIRPFTVERGRPTRLEISPAIHIGARGHKGKDGKFAVWLSVKGEHDSGLSIYRDGDLIPVRYTIRNKAGKQLVSGTIDYGWGGGGQAQSGLDADTLKGATVTLDLDEPPFEIRGSRAFSWSIDNK